MAHHDLKLNVMFFQHVLDLNKKSEARFNDRNYQVGDTFTLHEGQQEIDGFKYTGRKVSGVFSYMSTYGMQAGFVNLSLDKVGLLIVDEKCSAT